MDDRRRSSIRMGMALALAALMPGARAQPGLTAASLTSADHNGIRIDLADLRGRVVLVTFYAAGCAVCASELTLVREFHAANKARGFSVIAVSVDEREDDFRSYARLQQMTVTTPLQFPVVWRKSPAHQDNFGPVSRRPTHVLVNRSGQEALRRVGGLHPTDWDEIWLALG